MRNSFLTSMVSIVLLFAACSCEPTLNEGPDESSVPTEAVGTLLEVGRGVREPESILDLFGARRCESGEMIPACGLCLMEVTF